jgi:hypothetical protein
MKFLKDLFSEDSTLSSMRVMSMVCCISAVIVAIVGLKKPSVDYSGLALLCSVFLSAAMGGKVLQKRIEVSGAQSESNIETKKVDSEQ